MLALVGLILVHAEFLPVLLPARSQPASLPKKETWAAVPSLPRCKIHPGGQKLKCFLRQMRTASQVTRFLGVLNLSHYPAAPKLWSKSGSF